MIKEIPVLFATPMVIAIDNESKFMTRRLIKKYINGRGLRFGENGWENWHGQPVKCPYKIGDMIWVKETWNILYDLKYVYKAQQKPEHQYLKWKPSLFMPKKAARIWLRITDVYPEQLHDISEDDAIAEGIEKVGNFDWRYYNLDGVNATINKPVLSFQSLWESINGPDSWEENPWVWVVKFKKIDR